MSYNPVEPPLYDFPSYSPVLVQWQALSVWVLILHCFGIQYRYHMRRKCGGGARGQLTP